MKGRKSPDFLTWSTQSTAFTRLVGAPWISRVPYWAGWSHNQESGRSNNYFAQIEVTFSHMLTFQSCTFLRVAVVQTVSAICSNKRVMECDQQFFPRLGASKHHEARTLDSPFFTIYVITRLSEVILYHCHGSVKGPNHSLYVYWNQCSACIMNS